MRLSTIRRRPIPPATRLDERASSRPARSEPSADFTPQSARPPTAWPALEVLSDLIVQAQQAPEVGTEALLARLRPPLLHYFASRFVADAAEDLVQETLLRIARALPSIEPRLADRFIATITSNVRRTALLRRGRESARRSEAGTDHLPAGPKWAADRHLEWEELLLAVHRVAAASLPPKQRQVVLALLRGDTSAEIAARLHISPVTVRTRLMRARTALRRELAGYLDPIG